MDKLRLSKKLRKLIYLYIYIYVNIYNQKITIQ